jgi:ABC-type nitrate/sulfonate/bicarbonate transport system ATPase subunit
MTALIDFERVSRDFDNGRIVALRDVNLTVAKADSVAIVGASGSGKTTLIMLMSGIMLPTAGGSAGGVRRSQALKRGPDCAARKSASYSRTSISSRL